MHLQCVWGNTNGRLVTIIVPGQDIGIRLQAFLGWINNYGHLPCEKQQELLWELGPIEIGVGTLVATNEGIDGAVA